jgi:hypothetical protein
VRGFENSENVRVVPVMEGVEDVLLPLDVIRTAETFDAETLSTGEVFEIDAPNRRDVATPAGRDVGGFGQRDFDPGVEAVVTRRGDDETVGRASEQLGRDSSEILIDARRDNQEIAVMVDC